MDGSRLQGSGGAPLVATRTYAFDRGVTPTGEGRLGIPYMQRGSWDDHGVIERPEQEVFVARLIASLGARARTGCPGEWIFAEMTELDLVWEALTEAVRPPATTVPTGSARRAVSREDAAAAAGGLTRRFLDLVGVVAGVTSAFECVESRIDYGDYDQCTRNELWRSGEVQVRLSADGITSGHGVHGEACSLTMTVPGSEGRDASVHARIDMRFGGDVSVTVQGVLDAQALADRFVAPG